MGYAEAYWLAQDAAFKQKVLMAMVQVAANVASENPDTPHHTERVAYGTLCLRQIGASGDESPKLAYSVALDPLGVGIGAESEDGAFYDACSAVWNAHAGQAS